MDRWVLVSVFLLLSLAPACTSTDPDEEEPVIGAILAKTGQNVLRGEAGDWREKHFLP